MLFGRGMADQAKKSSSSAGQRTLTLICSMLEGDFFSRSQPMGRCWSATRESHRVQDA